MDASPIAWRLIIKQSQTSQLFYSSFLGDKIHIELDETEIDLSKVTSKLLYNKFKTKKQTPPFAQNKMKNKYPQLVVEWKKIYRGIHADVIVYIFAHLHTTLRTEENLLGVYWLQATKELVKVKTWLKF